MAITPLPRSYECVGVGTPVTQRPPQHGSVRDDLPHTALTSGTGVDAVTLRAQRAALKDHLGSGSEPGSGVPLAVPLGQWPSLLPSARGLLPALVRAFRRCRIGGGALVRWPRPPLKLHVRFSPMQLSRRHPL